MTNPNILRNPLTAVVASTVASLALMAGYAGAKTVHVNQPELASRTLNDGAHQEFAFENSDDQGCVPYQSIKMKDNGLTRKIVFAGKLSCSGPIYRQGVDLSIIAKRPGDKTQILRRSNVDQEIQKKDPAITTLTYKCRPPAQRERTNLTFLAAYWIKPDQRSEKQSPVFLVEPDQPVIPKKKTVIC